MAPEHTVSNTVVVPGCLSPVTVDPTAVVLALQFDQEATLPPKARYSPTTHPESPSRHLSRYPFRTLVRSPLSTQATSRPRERRNTKIGGQTLVRSAFSILAAASDAARKAQGRSASHADCHGQRRSIGDGGYRSWRAPHQGSELNHAPLGSARTQGPPGE
jgi:hypothetical protein